MKYLAAIDIETTGLQSDYHEITEITMVLLNENIEELGRVHDYVKILHPERGLRNIICYGDKTINIFEMTGIDPDKLNHSPTPHKICGKIDKFITSLLGEDIQSKDIILLAQNARFTESFVKQMFNQSECPYPFSCNTISVDTIYMTMLLAYKGFLPTRTSQKHIAKELNIGSKNSLTNDVDTTIEIFREELRQLKQSC